MAMPTIGATPPGKYDPNKKHFTAINAQGGVGSQRGTNVTFGENGRSFGANGQRTAANPQPQTNYFTGNQGSQQGGGYFNSPGYQEQLYNERRTGTDPYFNYMKGNLVNQNFNSFAARGMNNSTMAGQAQNNMLSGLAAQQAQDMFGLARGASDEVRNRYADQFDRQFAISNAESGAIQNSYLQGIDALSDAQKNAILAELSASGVGAEEINHIRQLMMGGTQIAIAADKSKSG